MQPFILLTSPCIYPSKEEDAREVRSGWIFGNRLTHDSAMELDSAMESWDTRMKGLHHTDRSGPCLLVPPVPGEVSHLGEKMQRCTNYRMRLHILHTQQS